MSVIVFINLCQKKKKQADGHRHRDKQKTNESVALCHDYFIQEMYVNFYFQVAINQFSVMVRELM